MKNILSFLFCLLAIPRALSGQDLGDLQDQEGRIIAGIVTFSEVNERGDSGTSQAISTAIEKVLLGTKKFVLVKPTTLSDIQSEFDRSRGTAFYESMVIDKSKSLGIKILFLVSLESTEIYKDKNKYFSKVKYNIKCIDITSARIIAAMSFTGNSKAYDDFPVSLSFNERVPRLINTLFTPSSETNKEESLKAIEESMVRVNAWIHRTFGFYLSFLKVLEESEKNGAEFVLVEGGEIIAMRKGRKLRMVLITKITSTNGDIQDEEPIADLEVVEVRSETAKCKVLRGGKRVMEERKRSNIRVLF